MNKQNKSLVIGLIGLAAAVCSGVAAAQAQNWPNRAIRVINADRTISVSAALREKGYRVTEVPGQGRNGPVELSFLVIRRRQLQETIELIETIAPDGFITVERADRASGGPFTESAANTPGFFRRAMEMVGKEG